MPLTDTTARLAKPQEKPQKLTDGGGLYLYVGARRAAPGASGKAGAGAKSWRYDYRYLGKRQTLVLGAYPSVTVKEARARHALARRTLEAGENPAAIKAAEKASRQLAAENTFMAVAEAWRQEIAGHRSRSWNMAVRGWLENYVYPAYGSKPLEAIQPTDVLTLIRRIADAGKPRTAETVRWITSRVFKYAIRNLRAKQNPASEIRGAVPVPPTQSHPHLSAKELPEFLAKADRYDGRPETALALILLLLTFVRKNELVGAKWDEIDLKAAEWRIPAERMKMKEPHIVPLSKQAVAAFKELKALARAPSEFAFQHYGDPRRHMSGESLNYAVKKLGFVDRVTPHGFRATASTVLNEQGFRPDVIERQLAHAERNRVRAAYNRSEYLEERRQMMQFWSDYLDGLRTGAKVVNFRTRGKARA